MTMPEFYPVAWELFFMNGDSDGFTNDKGEASEYGENKQPLFTGYQIQQSFEAGRASMMAEFEPAATLMANTDNLERKSLHWNPQGWNKPWKSETLYRLKGEK